MPNLLVELTRYGVAPLLPVLLFLVLADWTITASAASAQVAFVYDELADEKCSAYEQIKGQWSSELKEKVPEFSALWAQVGPAMTGAVSTLTNKPFSPAGSVRLTLCATPSNSIFGLTVNMRYALASFTPTPVPLRYKVDTAFHELLHDFVSKHTPIDSPLLSENSAENRCVRNHLHLLALQKAVLLATNDLQSLEQVVAIDGQLPSGCYARAWRIVNSTPTAFRQYIAELSR